MNGLTYDPVSEPLSEREVEILRLISDGLSNREIAQELYLSLETIKWYNKQIYSKLGVGSRTQAAARARESGLLDAEQPAAPVATRPRPKHNLPVQITSFVGRAREIDEVKALLREAHLLTLTGPGGTGKTRLALQTASDMVEDFEDGAFFVDLTRTGRSALVPDVIASTLGIQEVAGQPISESLKNYLSGKRLLLVLDNFEHVVEAGSLVAELLSVAPGVKALVTSREALRVYGEQEYPVPPLTLPHQQRGDEPLSALLAYESVALFVQRAQAVKPDFEVTDEDAPVLAEICLRLDGLPLAIELAAARAKLFGPQVLLGQLEDRLATLQSGPRNLPDRHRTLRGAIAWSYDLLGGAEQTLFARLSVFRGGCDIDAAQAVCTDGLALDAVDGLESLLNKNLVRHVEGPQGEPRFVMLETIHEYAGEKLEALGQTAALQKRQAEYFTALAERAEPDTRAGADQLRWLQRLEADHGNLRAALEWSLNGGDTLLGLRLVGALGHFWYRQGHYAEGRHWTGRGLELSGGEDKRVRALLLHAAGLAAFFGYEREPGKHLHEESLALYRELGDRREVGWALLWISSHSFGQPDEYEEAVARIEEGTTILREVGDLGGVGQGLNLIGEIARMHGDYQRAEAAYTECVAIARQIGDKLREAMLIGNMGFLAQYDGDAQRARALFQHGLALALEIDHKPIIVHGIAGLAGTIVDLGYPERAARLMGAADALYDAMGLAPQPSDLPDYERTRAAVREQIGEEKYEAAVQAGRRMSLEEAVEYAFAADD